MQLDISTIITIATVLLGVLGALAKIIRDQDLKKMDATDQHVADLKAKMDKLEENLADARETIAGFGSTYLTRKEHNDECPAKRKAP